jgi:hypothetical protein
MRAIILDIQMAQQSYRQLQVSREITERNKTNKWHHSREDKDGKGKECTDNSHVTLMKNWWIRNNHINGYRDIKERKGRTTVAAQDQAINTNYFKNKILKEEVGSKC